MRIEESDRVGRLAGRGVRDRHGSEGRVERRIGQLRNAVLQQEGRRDAVVRSGETGARSKAEGHDVAGTVVEGMRVEQPESATHHGRRRERLPGKAGARAEVCPTRVIGGNGRAVHPDELHHAGRSGYRIDLVRIEGVHVEIVGDHRRIGFPPQAQVQRQIAPDGPVVLRESRKVVHVALEVQRRDFGETGHESRQQGGESVAAGE